MGIIAPSISFLGLALDTAMKKKTRHRKGYGWRKKADSSPVAKGRKRPKIGGRRNPAKRKHLGGKGL